MNTSIIVSICIAFVGSSGFWALILYLFQRKDKEKTLINKALLALLHDKIYNECEKILAKGYITEDELNNLHHLYYPYSELGGNGVCKKLIDKISVLDIKKS